MNWPRFLRWCLAYFLVFGGGLYAFILILDPYQDVPFSPPMKRAPIAQNQRYSYPAVARDPAFDSAIVGTSTLRLLDPALLDAPLGARFANLSMNSATAYEQQRIHELFVRHHPAMKYLVLDIDDSWCKRAGEAEHYTFRAFPEWMYDDNRWNDLIYLFNDKALENAVRMWQYARGRRPAKYAANGYKDFTRELGPFRPQHTRKVVYGPEYLAQPPAFPAFEASPLALHPEWALPNLGELSTILAATPRETRIVLVFPPFHAYYALQKQPLVRECKARVLQLAASARATVIDYMIDSPLTRDDGNYWDPLHTTSAVAASIAGELVALLRDGTPPPAVHAVMLKAGARAAPERRGGS